MEFSRAKRILNLASTSGNLSKKSKNKVTNAEALLSYCCSQASGSISKEVEGVVDFSSDEEETENPFLPWSPSKDSCDTNLEALNNEVSDLLDKFQVAASEFPLFDQVQDVTFLDNSHSVDFHSEPVDVAYEIEIAEIERPEPTEDALANTSQPVSDESEVVSAAKVTKKSLSKRDRMSRAKEKHPLLPPSCKCKTDCRNSFEEDIRINIHEEFWKLDYNDRKKFIFSMVRKENVKRKRPSESKRERKYVYKYVLQKDDLCISVCQRFFLETLGFKDHQVVQTALKDNENHGFPDEDKRGKSKSSHEHNKIDPEIEEDVKNHIMSFDPQISHYRYEHAPNRLYLPPSLSVNKMYDLYKTNAGKDVSYEFYRQRVRDLNISFAKLGEEECEVCIQQELHVCEPTSDTPCDECRQYEDHKVKATKGRELYKRDAASNQGNNIFSADLQKVVMLPRMPGCKTVIFTKRIVAYNETFAPVGNKKVLKEKGTPYAITWHEGVTKRDGDDIASAFIKWLSEYGINEKEVIVIWLDNCTGQGKNWYLYTALVGFINSTFTKLKMITLRYFEKGHTFMSADSYHHQVEKSLKEMKNVYDFEDWVSALNKQGSAIILSHKECYDFPKGLSQAQYAADKPYLTDVVEVSFKEGSTCMFWKEDYDEEDYRNAEFLQKKYIQLFKEGKWPTFNVKYQVRPKGVKESKKGSIIDKLCPLMPEKSKKFWFNLEVNYNDASDDEEENA